MFCTNCGSKLASDWKVCPQCSTPVTEENRKPQRPKTINPTPPGILTERINSGPSVWFYTIGAAFIIIPFILAMILLITSLIDSDPDTRFVVPGTQVLEFDEAGKYTIYYEYQSTVEGRGYSTGEYLKDMVVTLESERDHESIKIKSASGDMSYEYGSRAGKSMFEFEIEEPGTYLLTTEYQDGSSTPQVVFAVGPSVDVIQLVFAMLALIFGGLILGVLIIVLVAVKRRNAKRKNEGIYPGMQYQHEVSPKSRTAVSLLAWFLGPFGAHRFYLEKIGTGLLMLFTFGGLGIWALIDFIMAVCGEMKDNEGRPITKW